MASIYKLTDFHLTMVSGTALELKIPYGSKEHLFEVDPDTAWEWSSSETQIATSGVQMKAGTLLTIDGPIAAQSLWVKQTSGGPTTLKWAYLYPGVR